MPLSERLFAIIFRLMRGDKLTTKALSEEFDISQRAIQHDLNERLPNELQVHLKTENGYYFLDPLAITSFFPEHIYKILELLDTENVLPQKFNKQSLQQLLSYNKDDAPFKVISSRRSVLDERNKQIHTQLEKAIKQNLIIKFVYRKNTTDKTYSDVEPYKLIDHQGIWYLAAVDAGKLKTFTLANIYTVNVEKSTFSRKNEIEALIEKDESIWLSKNKFAVELVINADYAEYFTRRNVIPNQTTEVNTDKTVTVRAEVTDENEILPIIRYWLPAVKTIKPESLKLALVDELDKYKKYFLKENEATPNGAQ